MSTSPAQMVEKGHRPQAETIYRSRMKQRLVRGLIMLLAGAVFWMMYSVIHETGHILALKTFGAWGQGRALLLPLPGQAPHVAGDPSAHLEHWQVAVAAISGGLLPTLVGYLSFVLWLILYGNRHHSKGRWVERIWLVFTIIMVFPQAVPAPMLFPNAIHDRDYSLFIQNVSSPWLANTAIAVIALINLTIVVWLVQRLWSSASSQRDNPALQRIGRAERSL